MNLSHKIDILTKNRILLCVNSKNIASLRQGGRIFSFFLFTNRKN